MSKIKAGRLDRRLFTLLALLACLTPVTPSNTSTTIAAAPPPPSGYQLWGTVYYWYSDVVGGPTVVIHKWNGSSWALHGATAGDACGNYTYDTGGPGQFKASVAGTNIVNDAYSCGAMYYSYRTVSGSNTTELSSASPYANLSIYTW